MAIGELREQLDRVLSAPNGQVYHSEDAPYGHATGIPQMAIGVLRRTLDRLASGGTASEVGPRRTKSIDRQTCAREHEDKGGSQITAHAQLCFAVQEPYFILGALAVEGGSDDGGSQIKARADFCYTVQAPQLVFGPLAMEGILLV